MYLISGSSSSGENLLSVVEPLGVVDGLEPAHVILLSQSYRIDSGHQLRERGTHCMEVGDIHEGVLDVGVEDWILHASATSTIDHSCELRYRNSDSTGV